MSYKKILLANDDGIHALGLQVLEAALAREYVVYTVAPEYEQSAKSQALSLHEPLRVKKYGERRFSVTGTPTDSVYLGLHQLVDEKPDLVVSGINHGPNLGTDILYSGTVGAAMEGAMNGIPSMAVSLCLPRPDASPISMKESYVVAADTVVRLLRKLRDEGIPSRSVLNVNIPHNFEPETGSFQVCPLGQETWKHSVFERRDPRGRPYYWIGGERLEGDPVLESDGHVIEDGVVAITPLHSDLTDYDLCRKLSENF